MHNDEIESIDIQNEKSEDSIVDNEKTEEKNDNNISDISTLGEDNKSIKLSSKGLFKLLGILAFFTFIVIVAKVVSTKKINLNDYIVFRSQGYNGYGEVYYEFDYRKMLADNFNSKYSKGQYDDYAGSFKHDICGEVSEKEKLSNGQIITYKWNDFDEKKWNKTFGCKFKYSDIKYTVSDLNELEELDAFSGIEMTCNGFSGTAWADVNLDAAPLSSSYYIVERKDDLRNGDTITVSVNEEYIDYIEETMGYKISTLKKEFVVEGLEEIKKVDVFANFEPKFSGYDGFGRVEMCYINENKKPEPWEDYLFYCDNDGYLKNGDEITVSLFDNMPYELKEFYGIEAEYIEKQYTVSGLNIMAETLSQIPADVMEKMIQQGLDAYNTHIANVWACPEKVSNVKYEGAYLFYPKEHSSELTNCLMLVYGADYRKKDRIYWYIKYDDLSINSEGLMNIDYASYDSSSNPELPGNERWHGYKSYDTFCARVVSGMLENYNYDTTFELSN